MLNFNFIANAYAHGDHHVDITPAPVTFDLKWAWDPTLIFFGLMACLYILGLRSYRGKSPVTTWQKSLFFIGIVVLLISDLPPIDTYADQLFSIHMVQHMLMISLGVPLLIFGAPFIITIRGFPKPIRKKILIPIVEGRSVRSFLRVLQQPLIAAMLYEITFWFWHIPRFYNLALLNDAIHLVEHACMALAAMNLWKLLIDPYPLKSIVKLPIRILLVGLIMTMDMVLSAALTYSNKVWYAYDGLPMPDWWKWDRLQDQRLGGLIMWVPGGVVWLLTMAIIFLVWSRQEASRET